VQKSLEEKGKRRTHISGSVIPNSARARSRYALHAIKMLSVPPLVVVPAPPFSSIADVGNGQLYSDRHIETSSESILRTPVRVGAVGIQDQDFRVSILGDERRLGEFFGFRRESELAFRARPPPP
jgi:hypothetical protein